MKLYSAKINLAGNPDNQVLKHNMSAAELKVLEFIHQGKSPALLDVKHTGDVNRTEARERVRLAGIYSKSSREGFLPGVAIVEKLFGVSTLPLPDVYVAPTFEPIEVFDVEGDGEEEVITPAVAPPIVVTKLAPSLKDLTE